MNRWAYLVHRWLSLLAGAQILVWVATGVVFAFLPIDRVRGEATRAAVEKTPLDWKRIRPFDSAAYGPTHEVVLRTIDARPAYVASTDHGQIVVDASTGAELVIDEAAAARIALADQRSNPHVKSIERLKEAPIEYRGKPLPVWRVTLSDEDSTRIYVDARTGAIGARRNDAWRVYDFLWALHIMDYRERESFNHPLLQAFAALGLLTALSGIVVWLVRGGRYWRRRWTR